MAEHATQAFIGHGTQIQRGNSDGPPETFVQINEIITLDPPSAEADDIEVTHMESPNKYKEYIRGLIEPGEFSFSINWNPVDWPSHAQLRTDHTNGDVRNYRFVLPGAVETITFPAYVKTLKRNDESASAPVTADVVLRVVGSSTVV